MAGHDQAGPVPGPDGNRWFREGINRGNVSALLFCNWCIVMLMPFIVFVQPMLFEEVLLIPREQHGTLTAILVPVNDVIVLAVTLGIGALSDRYGRRALFVGGSILFGIGIGLYPLSESVADLIMYRMLIGAGAAAAIVTLATMLQDYPQEARRGTLSGLNSVIAGSGIMFMALVLSRIPEWLTARGVSPADAITWTFVAGGAVAVLAGCTGGLGLSDMRFAEAAPQQRLSRDIAEALGEARTNPLIRLGYAAGYVSKGDLGIVSAFFSLWFMNVGRNAGMESADILATSGMMFGLVTFSGLIAGPLFGRLADRIRREYAATLALGLAAIAYTAISLIDNPFDMRLTVPACILLGVAEIAAIVTCGTLIGQEAPAEKRGAVISCYQAAGTLGIASCVFVGGILFDRLGPTTPFLMMGFVNAAIVLYALWLFARRRAAPV